MRIIIIIILLVLHTWKGWAQNRSDDFDDVVQYVPFASMVVMKACGVDSRDSWSKMMIKTGGAWLLSAMTTYTLKHVVKEPRADESDHYSFPSGHTAFSFAGATMLDHEYRHVSPWISVAGYGVATFTAIRRVERERHNWFDVIAGAGIGFASAKVAFLLTDKWFKSQKVSVGCSANTIDVAIIW